MEICGATSAPNQLEPRGEPSGRITSPNRVTPQQRLHSRPGAQKARPAELGQPPAAGRASSGLCKRHDTSGFRCLAHGRAAAPWWSQPSCRHPAAAANGPAAFRLLQAGSQPWLALSDSELLTHFTHYNGRDGAAPHGLAPAAAAAGAHRQASRGVGKSCTTAAAAAVAICTSTTACCCHPIILCRPIHCAQ